MATADRVPRRRAARTLLVLLGAAVVAEVVLQLVAWRAWSTEWIGPAGDPTPGRVLLVGAGETFDEGVLLRADAWPGDVERRLRTAGVDATLVNGASPGRDSRDVLLRLPLQLTLERPAVVVACVGAEDLRRRSAQVVEESELRGRNAQFPLRFRLLSVLAAPFAVDSDALDAGAAPFVGPWHFGDVELAFEPGGRFRLGTIDARWTFDDDVLRVAIPGSDPFEVRWSLEGDRLTLTGGFAGGEVVVFRGAAFPGPSERALDAMQRGAWDEAEWMLVPAVRGAARDPEALATLVELLARWGRIDEARELLVELESEAAVTTATRARASIAVGSVEEGVELVADDLAAHVGNTPLVAALRRLSAEEPAARIADAAEQAMAAAPLPARVQLAWITADLRARQGREAAALRALAVGLGALEAEADPRVVPAIVGSADDARWGSATAPLSAAERGRADAHLARLTEADARTTAILGENLRRLVDLARFYGAEVLLLDPDDDPRASSQRRSVAGVAGVECVSCAPARDALVGALFDALVAEARRSSDR